MRTLTDPEEALDYLETAKMPIVLKADGLALGKGVLICNTLEEAKDGVKDDHGWTRSSALPAIQMVIEEFMTGREVSVLSFVDGKTIKIDDFRTGSQTCERRRSGAEYRWYGNFLSESVLYRRSGCIL